MSVVFLTNRNIISGTIGDCILFFDWTLLEDCPYLIRVRLSTDTNSSNVPLYLTSNLLTNVIQKTASITGNILANFYFNLTSPNRYDNCRMKEFIDINISGRPRNNYFYMRTYNTTNVITNAHSYELELHFVKELIERPLKPFFYTIGFNTADRISGTVNDADFYFDWTQIPRGYYDIRIKFESDVENISGLYTGLVICNAFETTNEGTLSTLYPPNNVLGMVEFTQGMGSSFLSVPYWFNTPFQGKPCNNMFNIKLVKSTSNTALAPAMSSIQYYFELTPKQKERKMYVFNSIDRLNSSSSPNNCNFNIKGLDAGTKYRVSYSFSSGLVDDSVSIPAPYIHSNLFNGLYSFRNTNTFTNLTTSSISIGLFNSINDNLTLGIDNTDFITEFSGGLDTNVNMKITNENGSLWTDGSGLCSDWVFLISFEKI